MGGYTLAAGAFAQNAKGVASAVETFQTALAGGDQSDIDFATELLARAADTYSGSAVSYRQMGFDELAAPAAAPKPKLERVSGDLLMSALMDLEVANALIVADKAASGTVPRDELDKATSRLDELAAAAALPLGRAIEKTAASPRFGFDEVPAPPTPPVSTDLGTAKIAYQKRVGDVQASLVAETRKVLLAAFAKLSGLSGQELADAIGLLGNTSAELPELGKLMARGLKLVLQTLQKITQLLQARNVQELQKTAQDILDQLQKKQDFLNQFLDFTYQLEKTNDHVKGLLDNTKADAARIDGGNKKLADLQRRFQEQMVIVSRIISSLGIMKSLVGLALPQGVALLVFGTSYFVAMDYAVVAGMDFADTSPFVDFVDGVVRISDATLATS